MSKTQQTNNPFALIQTYGGASRWKGLAGQRADGFLVFDTPRNGIRAGFINLVNTYFKRDRNTIASIIPVYAPDSVKPDGSNPYISFIEKQLKINRNQKIDYKTQPDLLFNLGLAIVQFEAGKQWVSKQDFTNGYNDAMEYLELSRKVEKAGMGIMAVVLPVIAWAIWKLSK